MSAKEESTYVLMTIMTTKVGFARCSERNIELLKNVLQRGRRRRSVQGMIESKSRGSKKAESKKNSLKGHSFLMACAILQSVSRNVPN